jgi:hypothetical protein
MDTIELLELKKEIKDLKQYISELSFEPERFRYTSENINELAGAFAKARLGFEKIGANKKSFDKNFADFPYIISKVNEGLAVNGLAFYQYTTIEDDSSCMLVTSLIHSSGQYINSRVRLILSDTDKNIDRTLQINKRMQALALLGIWPLEDRLDDDGDAEYEAKIVNEMSGVEVSTKKSKDVVTKEQYEMLMQELKGETEIAKMIMKRYDIVTLKDMPKESFIEDIERIRKIKIDKKNR